MLGEAGGRGQGGGGSCEVVLHCDFPGQALGNLESDDRDDERGEIRADSQPLLKQLLIHPTPGGSMLSVGNLFYNG